MAAASIRFVEQSTNIPVPHVWAQFWWFGAGIIVMSRIEGISLEASWKQLTDVDKECIVAQLVQFVNELRSIPPPSAPAITSITGGPIFCPRLHVYNDACGPFKDEMHLNAHIRCYRSLDRFPTIVADVHSRSHPLVFTHNDLFPRNIMIDGTTVTAIIDWEASGWLPSHWEFIPAFDEEAMADLEILRILDVPKS
ncbi:kinase-like protein [Fistulina hepatica ATCC 64428]|uniref:Kinase-like protein n=1 Tax=Fistulina hepatica ATCC 64428 TaxID=1128425 RepID=A0A0D7A250_9AGAR|nr:kinase-like protein [Fistulina hepatica ATCC 64428]